MQISQSSPGLVVKLQEKDSSDGDTTYAAVVEYRDQRGENFDFVDSFSSKPPAYFAGQRVIVLYNPNDPHEAQIDRGPLELLARGPAGHSGRLVRDVRAVQREKTIPKTHSQNMNLLPVRSEREFESWAQQ